MITLTDQERDEIAGKMRRIAESFERQSNTNCLEYVMAVEAYHALTREQAVPTSCDPRFAMRRACPCCGATRTDEHRCNLECGKCTNGSVWLCAQCGGLIEAVGQPCSRGGEMGMNGACCDEEPK